MRKTFSGNEVLCKNLEGVEGHEALEASHWQAVAGALAHVPQVSRMVGAEEVGHRRLRPQRGRPGWEEGEGLPRLGAQVKRGGQRRERRPRTQGAGSGRDWAADVLAGSASHLSGSGGRAGEESPQQGESQRDGGPAPPGESH